MGFDVGVVDGAEVGTTDGNPVGCDVYARQRPHFIPHVAFTLSDMTLQE